MSNADHSEWFSEKLGVPRLLALLKARDSGDATRQELQRKDREINELIVQMARAFACLQIPPSDAFVRVLCYRLTGGDDLQQIPEWNEAKNDAPDHPSFLAAVIYEIDNPNSTHRALAKSVAVHHDTIKKWRATKAWQRARQALGGG